ncbi:MAG: hypothetical protein EOM40_16175 [Clostridia bacterium]|nr:hypothetical protein [Clostridia bacterium]NCC44357.1 hypothetical protein [Clostridia bacterium]
MRKNSKKIRKGDYGYIHSEKIKRVLITIGLFLLPMSAFIGGVIVTGTNKNLVTVVAVVGCLPACKALVDAIVMFMQKPVSPSTYEQIKQHEGDLVVIYETYLTTYEKSTFVESFAICAGKVVGYSSRIDGSAQFVEDHVKKILKHNGYKTEVKVFKELKPYLDRLDYLNAHHEELSKGIEFEPDSRYPELSRDELIKHLILAISL